MASYTVVSVEPLKAKSGVEYKKATLQDDNGQSFEGVAVFKTFNNYNELAAGVSVVGALKGKDFRGKIGYTLENLTAAPRTFAPRTAVFGQAAERKAESISKSQDRKEEGIKISSTFRDATLIVTGLMQKTTTSVTREWIESEWRRWRAFLWKNYDTVSMQDLEKTDDAPPFE